MSDESAMGEVSVVILTYNEECNVRHALESVRWSNDVIVIDSFSTDKTEAICREFENVTFVQHAFKDLASQRQYALDAGLVRHEWVLALDADEVVPPELADELQAIARMNRSDSPVAYDMAMRYFMWGKWLKYSSEYPVYWRRFFRLDSAKYVQRGHADTVDVDGPVARTKHDLIHRDNKGLTDWLAKHNRYTSQEAEYAVTELPLTPWRWLISGDRLKRRRAVKRLFRVLPGNAWIRFLYLYVWRLGFLDGIRGYDFCRLRAQQHFIVHLKIRELRSVEVSGDI